MRCDMLFHELHFGWCRIRPRMRKQTHSPLPHFPNPFVLVLRKRLCKRQLDTDYRLRSMLLGRQHPDMRWRRDYQCLLQEYRHPTNSHHPSQASHHLRKQPARALCPPGLLHRQHAPAHSQPVLLHLPKHDPHNVLFKVLPEGLPVRRDRGRRHLLLRKQLPSFPGSSFPLQ
jgi:hypothetical protein